MIKIIQPKQIETATLGDILAVKIPKILMASSDNDFYFFIDIKSLKDKVLDLNKLVYDSSIRRYYHIDDFNSLKDLIPGTDEFYDQFENSNKQNSLKLLKSKKFSTKNLYYWYSEAHLWYRFRSNNPLTRTYQLDYIGGVTNQDYDLDKAERILKKNKWVSKVKRIEIPYYNQDLDRTSAIEFEVCLPQKVYDKLVKYYRDKIKEEFWTCRIKDALASPYSLVPFDVLGLLKALRCEKCEK